MLFFFVIFQTFSVAILLSTGSAYAMHKEKPPVSSRILETQSLTIPLPLAFKNRPVNHYTALIEQLDSFSCGNRVLFYALNLERAARKAQSGMDFHENLKWMFKDEKTFNCLNAKAYNWLCGEYSDPQIARGVQGVHLVAICQEKLGMLREKLLPLELDTHGDLFALHKKIPNSNPLLFTKEQLKDCDSHLEYVALNTSPEFSTLLKKLKNPYDMVHFACLASHHWILASLIVNQYHKAEIIVVEPGNYRLNDFPEGVQIVKKLLPYVDFFNIARRSIPHLVPRRTS